VPLPRYAFEKFDTAVLKRDPRSRHQVFHRARHEHLAGPGQRREAGAGVHGDAAELVTHHLALAGMEPHPDLQT
jgi:hypothetical protein